MRGVYRYRHRIEGHAAWYALTSSGEMIAPGLRIVWPHETEAEVVEELDDALRVADPVRPSYLQLVA